MVEIFQQAISLTSTFNLWLLLAIFAITLVAEFGFSIPYLLESIWLLTGYHADGGALSLSAVVTFCVISLIGRELGAVALYYISGYGRGPVLRLYHRMSVFGPRDGPVLRFLKKYLTIPLARLGARIMASSSPLKVEKNGCIKKDNGKVFCPSTLNIVLGRFAWLKIPITLTMSMTRRPLRLLVGVALFSLAWDSMYIILGLLGAGNQISSVTMIIGTVSTFITLNGILYLIRRYRAKRRLAHAEKTAAAPALVQSLSGTTGSPSPRTGTGAGTGTGYTSTRAA